MSFATTNKKSENTKRYKFTKMTRRSDAENPNPPMVYAGQSEFGYSKVLTDDFVTFAKENPEAKSQDYDKEYYEWQEEMKPKIGYPLVVHGGHFSDWIRTSCIKSYYVCDDADNHPDKLVLPNNFPIQDIGEIPEMKKGDVLVATMNSIYYAELLEK